MKQEKFCPFPPERKELAENPLSPRLIMEIARLLRARVRDGESEDVMQQNTARVVLAHLAGSGTMPQLQLVERTHLKPPTVSVLLRRMEEEGYVRRTPDRRDRRAVLVELTEKGRAFDRNHLKRISSNDRVALRDFTPEECATLEALLCRVRHNLTGGQNG